MANAVNSTSGTGFLGSLTSFFTGDSAAGAQAMVDTRSFSQKYGSWESDRNGNKFDPEAAAAEMSAKFSRREKLIINSSAGLSENGVRMATATGYTPPKEAANDARIGVTTTGANFAQFRSMGRIAA